VCVFHTTVEQVTTVLEHEVFVQRMAKWKGFDEVENNSEDLNK
jgi:hypothetical protein